MTGTDPRVDQDHQAWRDAAGSVVMCSGLEHPARARDLEVQLAPGSYEVEVIAGSGARAVTKLVIRDLRESDEILEIRLP